ncbi:MAG TPA: hypothetical protein DIU07_20465 [Rhodobacteraceae bacterium]|nr:hypothetical protein [Paracoccaceae bacterium]
MVNRIPGAIARAFFMVLLVSTPALLIPHVSPDTTQIVVLIALFAAALTFFEYATDYPGLVEFRDAPPFNRIRFTGLYFTVFLLSILVRGHTIDSTSTQFVEAVGSLIGQAIDIPYSPVRLITLMLPDTASAQDIDTLRTASGMAYLISLVSLAVFMIVLRVSNWPHNGRKFNFWVNLPMFDPTTGGDVVDRLERDSRFNVAIGFMLPFLTPAIVKAASGFFGSVSVINDMTMIWTITAWAFLPASLFMRGIAMQRLADMIKEQRARHVALHGEDGLQPA